MDNAHLRQIVVKEGVFDDPQTLEGYSKDESFAPSIRPRFIVKVKNTKEVQEVVEWANETLTPLIPVSSGPPRFRGDTVPGVDGAVIVDLSQMKKIIRIDRKNRVAMVEPGVTFGELIPELEKEGLSPYMPLAPRSSKSVVASSLEREPVTIPRDHWESQDPTLCAEIIYGSGNLFRTGSAAGPGSIQEQWKAGKAQVRGLGPSQVDFTKLIQAAQGTMGIVTWASIKCNLLPKVNKTFLISADRIDQLIDFTYKLMWKKLGDECLILNAQNLSSILAENPESIEVLRQNIPRWVLIINIEGSGFMPQERVEYQEAEIMEVAQSHDLKPLSTISNFGSKDILNVLSRPSKEPYWKQRVKGSSHDIFFLTTLDRSPEFVSKMSELTAAYHLSPSDLGVYIQPTVQGTNCHCEFTLNYDPRRETDFDKVKKLDNEAASIFADMGGFFSRPYGRWSNIAYRRCSDTVAGLRKVKQIFDPNGIMNPGKLCF